VLSCAVTAIPRPAATTILVREGPLRVYLLQRHRASGFMANAYVFPGGKVDDDDGTAEIAAIRELFEEAGVLLVAESTAPDARATWRRRLLDGEVTFTQLLAEQRLTPRPDALAWWSRWITPSFEPRRFDAHFFFVRLPDDQEATLDQRETVAERWATPDQALAAHTAGEIRLPPPQRRTLAEMNGLATFADLVRESERRRAHPHPICPRFFTSDGKITLLLPWDPDYAAAEGEGEPMPEDHPLAVGESRYVFG
jgi:8-oxo-dGTP pyrophosphatase MutT (NUDIX family)